MQLNFEELDHQKTSLGELILRRRRVPSLGDQVVYEVKLNDEFLMSSLFYEAEVALTDLGLGALSGAEWDVVVGGLGLGYTAAAALKFDQVKTVTVVEALAPVIDWHERELVPNGKVLNEDKRTTYHCADFFQCARTHGFDPQQEGRQFDAVLLDIDHAPDYLLNTSHGDFYTEAGLEKLKTFLKPGGVFALWSNDPPEEAFLQPLKKVFGQAEGHTIYFENPIQGGQSTNGVYVARLS